MATTGYTSTGAFLSSAYGICRMHAEIEYTPTRSNNTITFSSTYGRIKHVRETGTWTSQTHGAGWRWYLYIPNGTYRTENFSSGTVTPNQTQNGNSVGFTYTATAGQTSVVATVGGLYVSDGMTHAWHTLYFPAAGAPTGSTASASNIQSTTATLNASLSSWGTHCTAGTGQRIEYRKSGGTWTNLAYSTSASHSRNVTGLSPGATYEVRTYTVNGAGLTANSSTITFQTKSGVKVILPNGTVEDRLVKQILPSGVVTERVVTKVV